MTTLADANRAKPEQHPSAATYLATYVALLALATASLLLSQLGVGGVEIALLIAGVKATLVLWIFMHLSEQHASSRVAMIVAVGLMATLIALTSLDVATRHTFPGRTEPPPSSGFYQR